MVSDYLTTESEDVKRIYADIDLIDRTMRIAVQKYKPSIAEERFFSSEQVCSLLNISSRTLQTLRDSRQITYSAISGRTFLYPESDIQKILEQNLSLAQV